ncbi:aspartyl protease family protein 2 [Euphorbia lathyris]|uniref:aspartyl protease family protein 2 n=1 Tax=Euphorbia lathyris TaxID=212925 RepID=UPI003313F655
MVLRLLSSLLFLTFTDLCYSVDYLKLPLLHTTPFASPSEALAFDIRRLSFLHHQRQAPLFKSPVISGAYSGSGQYFVSLHLGSPPQSLRLVADTGSDLVWVKCSACNNCSAHNPGSAFLARHSSTFSPIHCFDSKCQLVPRPRPNPCNHTRLHSPCRYEYSYADGSLSTGFFSVETTALNSSSGRLKKLNNLAFGCGFKISGPSLTGPSFGDAHGVMGLGRSPISFSSQLGRRFGNKFSYCLMDYNLSPPPTSFLMIGGVRTEVSKNRSINFTPLLVNPLSPTFYFINIKTVSVNGVRLKINPSVWSIDDSGNGGTIIDSGTTLSFVAQPAYNAILSAFKRKVKQPSPAELTPGFDLCINVSGISRPVLPRLSFRLAGGSVFSPPPRNYFLETGDGVRCLAIQAGNSVGGFSVIGNLMQQGYLLEFDRDRSRLGFSRSGCALPLP